MRNSNRIVWLILVVAVPAAAQERGVAILHNLKKVVTDAVPDMTTVESLLADIIRPDMTDEQKCTAVWKLVHRNQFWNSSSRLKLRRRFGGTDPVVMLNCSAQTICQQDSDTQLRGLGRRHRWQRGTEKRGRFDPSVQTISVGLHTVRMPNPSWEGIQIGLKEIHK